MTSSRTFLVTCTLVLLAPAPARAQKPAADIESARQLYNQGIELRDKGDLPAALEKFKAAHALGNTPITGLELCKTHATLRQPVEAREVCLGVARIPPTQAETPRSQEARAEAGRVAEEVKPRIAGLRLRLVGVPPGRVPTVVVDGVTIPPPAIGEPRAVNPGAHDVAARVGRGPETRARVDVREGEPKDLELTVQAGPEEEPPPGAAPPPGAWQPQPRPEKKSSLATVGFVIAGVAGGIGAVTGVLAISAKGDLDDKCAQKICGTSEHDALDRAKTWGNVSTAMFVVAGAGVAMGIWGTVINSKSAASAPPPRRAQLFVGPTGVGVHGAF